MRKKIFGSILGLSLCLFLTGCSNRVNAIITHFSNSNDELESEIIESDVEAENGGFTYNPVDAEYELDYAIESCRGESEWVCGPYVYELYDDGVSLSLLKYDERSGMVSVEDASPIKSNGGFNNWLVYDDCIYYTTQGSWWEPKVVKYNYYTSEVTIIAEQFYDGIKEDPDGATIYKSKLVLYNDELYYISYDYDVTVGTYTGQLHAYDIYTGEDRTCVNLGEVEGCYDQEVSLYRTDRSGRMIVLTKQQLSPNIQVGVFDPNKWEYLDDMFLDLKEVRQNSRSSGYDITDYAIDAGRWEEYGYKYDDGVVFLVSTLQAEKYGLEQSGIYVLNDDNIDDDKMKMSNMSQNGAKYIFRPIHLLGVTDSGQIIFKDDKYYSLDATTGELNEFSAFN